MLRDASDPYVQQLCEREMTARLKRVPNSKSDFCAAQSECVLDWTQRDEELLASAGTRLQASLEKWAPAALEVLSQSEISLFLTSGAEETGLSSGLKSRIAYCRRDRTVFFSRAYVNWENPAAVQHLLLHELWHIASRNMDPNLLDQVYAQFGFVRIRQTLVNSSPHRLTNPDGLFIQHAMRRRDGSQLAPVLMLAPRYDVLSPSESLFDHMLMMMAPLTESDNFEGTVVDVRSVGDVFQHIGHNTQYLLHIDEVVAGWFVFLVVFL